MDKAELLKMPCRHLGDGAYVSHAGYALIIWTDRADEGGVHWVMLETWAVHQLEDFIKKGR